MRLLVTWGFGKFQNRSIFRMHKKCVGGGRTSFLKQMTIAKNTLVSSAVSKLCYFYMQATINLGLPEKKKKKTRQHETYPRVPWLYTPCLQRLKSTLPNMPCTWSPFISFLRFYCNESSRNLPFPAFISNVRTHLLYFSYLEVARASPDGAAEILRWI